ncbi:hypothetical protein A2U01_0086530, partial [Trifolium medium]|nr:hypothetical protein [Trifolium medium]
MRKARGARGVLGQEKEKEIVREKRKRSLRNRRAK